MVAHTQAAGGMDFDKLLMHANPVVYGVLAIGSFAFALQQLNPFPYWTAGIACLPVIGSNGTTSPPDTNFTHAEH